MKVGDVWYFARMPVYRDRALEIWRGSAVGPAFRAGEVYYEAFMCFKVTPKGGWFSPVWGGDDLGVPPISFEWLKEHRRSELFWVTPATRKIRPSREEALESLRRRTDRYVSICRDRLEQALVRQKALGVQLLLEGQEVKP